MDSGQRYIPAVQYRSRKNEKTDYAALVSNGMQLGFRFQNRKW